MSTEARSEYFYFGVAAAMLAVITGTNAVSKKVPGALIAVAGAIFAAFFFHLEKFVVMLLRSVPSGLPRFGLPELIGAGR